MNKVYEAPSIRLDVYQTQDIVLASGNVGDSQQDIFGMGGLD